MSPMSDDLRARIAAAIECERNKWAGSDAASETLADAVIRELSLMIDDSYRIGCGNAFIVHGYYEVRDSR